MDGVTEPFGGVGGCRQPAPPREAPKQPDTPELDRLASVSELSHKIGEFLDWLSQRYTICLDENRFGEVYFYPGNVWPGKLLAEYFQIDLDKVEQEKLSLLQHLRSRNEQG